MEAVAGTAGLSLPAMTRREMRGSMVTKAQSQYVVLVIMVSKASSSGGGGSGSAG